VLEDVWREAESLGFRPVSLALGARPDEISEPHLDVLERFAAEHFPGGRELWIELGVQTTDPAGLLWLRRGYDAACLPEAARRIRARGPFLLCGHLISGMPEESPDRLAESAADLAHWGFDSVKFHPLHVLKGTALAELWRGGAYDPLEMESYADRVARALRVLPEGMPLQRLTADARPPELLAPRWVAEKPRVLGPSRPSCSRREPVRGIGSARPPKTSGRTLGPAPLDPPPGGPEASPGEGGKKDAKGERLPGPSGNGSPLGCGLDRPGRWGGQAISRRP
jgi:radical SAM protein (TIGR01212 family)